MSENSLESKINDKNFASLKLPTRANFYDFTGIPKYDDSKEKQKLLEDNENWDQKEKIEERIKNARMLISILLTGAGIYIYIKVNIVIFILVLVIFLLGFIFLIIKTNPIIKKYQKNSPTGKPNTEEKGRSLYLENVLNKIRTDYLNSFRGFEFDNWGFLFYSNLGCVCIELNSGEMVLYGKENIKDVLLEHVQLGTSTSGSSTSYGDMYRGLIFNFHYTQYSDSIIDTDSIQHYEWRLDILTDYIEFPKLSFRFEDNSIGEDEAKIIYGILKPK